MRVLLVCGIVYLSAGIILGELVDRWQMKQTQPFPGFPAGLATQYIRGIVFAVSVCIWPRTVYFILTGKIGVHMNPTLKNVLVISAKNAVRGILNGVGGWGIDPKHFNLATSAGIQHLALLAASTIVSTEAVYWGPKILKWAQNVPSSVILLPLVSLAWRIRLF